MGIKKYQTDILKQIDEPLIKQWKELWEKGENSNVYNSYEWFLTCQETYKLTNLEFHVCYNNEGKLVAIMPLSAYRHFFIKVSGTICNNFLVDTAFLVEKLEPELLKYFYSSIIMKRNIYIHKIDKESVKILHRNFPDILFSLISVNPYINFSQDPMQTISKSTIHQIKKIIRKNPGQITFKTFEKKDDLNKHLQTMFNIEQSSSKKLRHMDIFSKEDNKTFFRNLIKNCGKKVRICYLYYNQIPVAYQFGFLHNKIFEAYQTSYLYEYGKIRPGKTMIFHLIESLKNNNINILDLGGGISSYKQEFTPNYRLLYDIYYSKSILVLTWWKCINFLRRIKQIVFPKKFTQDHKFLFKTFS